jgi:hypothetical protein
MKPWRPTMADTMRVCPATRHEGGFHVPADVPARDFIEAAKRAAIAEIQKAPPGEWPSYWYGLDGDTAFLAYLDRLVKKDEDEEADDG